MDIDRRYEVSRGKAFSATERRHAERRLSGGSPGSLLLHRSLTLPSATGRALPG